MPIKTYILAPNWTTAPPPDGPLQLGHILLSPTTKLTPINHPHQPRCPIPPVLLAKPHTRSGFRTTRSDLLSGNLGLFARILGLLGLGAEAHYRRDSNDVLTCEHLVTLAFEPDEKYIKESVEKTVEAQRFFKGSKGRGKVYMVTGMKVAAGEVGLRSLGGKGKGVSVVGGTGGGLLGEVGAAGGLEMEERQGESWEGADPFIVAVRVRKIWYVKGGRGGLRDEEYRDKAFMEDGSGRGKGKGKGEGYGELVTGDEIALGDVADDGLELEVERGVGVGDDGEEEEEEWIVPRGFGGEEGISGEGMRNGDQGHTVE